MNILITGVQNAIEESVVRLAVERIEGKADFKMISFSEFAGGESPLEEIDVIRNTQQKVTDSIRMKLMNSTGGHVIINGYCTVRTKLGFFPVLTRETVEALKPQLMVHIDVDPAALEGKIDDAKAYDDHQDVEKAYSFMLCTAAGCGIRAIHCGPDGARKASDELHCLLKDILVKK